MVEVDFDKIVERCDELVTYDEFLPLLVRALIMRRWSNHLESVGKYDEIIQECVDNKPHGYDDAVKELVDWVKKNPSYKDFIN